MITVHLYPAGMVIMACALLAIFIMGLLIGFKKGIRYTENKFCDRLQD